MGLLSWIIVGALAGWLASKIMGTDAHMGAIANIVVGIIGAFIGGFIVGLLGGTGVTGFNLWSILVALLGSVVFIWVVRKIRG
ncbi:GlsB/YeaQ/YmgE family stress response membrane protein [Ruminococcaceae bacterium OttesenSCG-928-O06]|nr:GlsB/YeaQ/YmgE family stress response membrane protein [Ruminococcaceae bacterium OttesenSCG-928-O06]